MCNDKARDFIGKEHPGGEQEGKGTQENCSATWPTVWGFKVMGLVSGWSLANHSNSESFLVAPHHSAKMDASERDSGTWTDTVSSFDLSQTLPVGGGLLSSLFLIRISHCKTTHAKGYYGAWPGWAVSISVLPLTVPHTNRMAVIKKTIVTRVGENVGKGGPFYTVGGNINW